MDTTHVAICIKGLTSWRNTYLLSPIGLKTREWKEVNDQLMLVSLVSKLNPQTVCIYNKTLIPAN